MWGRGTRGSGRGWGYSFDIWRSGEIENGRFSWRACNEWKKIYAPLYVILMEDG
jgi:hypothetical protein